MSIDSTYLKRVFEPKIYLKQDDQFIQVNKNKSNIFDEEQALIQSNNPISEKISEKNLRNNRDEKGALICPISYESIEEKNKVIVTDCNYLISKNSFLEHIKSNSKDFEQVSCPMCRGALKIDKLSPKIQEMLSADQKLSCRDFKKCCKPIAIVSISTLIVMGLAATILGSFSENGSSLVRCGIILGSSGLLGLVGLAAINRYFRDV